MSIKVYPQGTLERKRLGDFCTVLHDITGGRFEVQDIYFDLGQDWKWTTIVCKDQNYQILNPNQHNDVIKGYEDECIDEIVKSYFDIKKLSLKTAMQILENKESAWKSRR